jgi:valyl-tRNA synthetase
VKERAYGEPGAEQASAVAALKTALSALLRLFAPFIPFAAEEAWSWSNDSSVHTAPWPVPGEVTANVAAELARDGVLLELASRALTGIRRAKTDAKASQKTPVTSAVISGTTDEVGQLELVSADFKAVGRIADLTFVEGSELAVTDIVLATMSES